MALKLFGVPKGGCFDQGLFSNLHLAVFAFCVVFVAPRNTGICSLERGLFSSFHLVVSVVLVVSSVKTKNPLPKQPPSSTLSLVLAKLRLRSGLCYM